MKPLTKERWYPTLFGVATLLVGYSAALKGFPLPNGDAFLGGLVSLGGILAGFVATLKTMLLAMSSTIAEQLRKSGYAAELQRYLNEALWSALTLASFAVLGFSKAFAFDEWSSVLLGGLAWAIATLFRVSKIGTLLLTAK